MMQLILYLHRKCAMAGAVGFISLITIVGGDESCVMGQVEEALKGSCSVKCINENLKGKKKANISKLILQQQVFPSWATSCHVLISSSHYLYSLFAKETVTIIALVSPNVTITEPSLLKPVKFIVIFIECQRQHLPVCFLLGSCVSVHDSKLSTFITQAEMLRWAHRFSDCRESRCFSFCSLLLSILLLSSCVITCPPVHLPVASTSLLTCENKHCSFPWECPSEPQYAEQIAMCYRSKHIYTLLSACLRHLPNSQCGLWCCNY